jgi:hypothetical protein
MQHVVLKIVHRHKALTITVCPATEPLQEMVGEDAVLFRIPLLGYLLGGAGRKQGKPFGQLVRGSDELGIGRIFSPNLDASVAGIKGKHEPARLAGAHSPLDLR